MTIDTDNIVDFSPSLRLIGTAHVSSKSVEMVRKEISEYEPDIVAVELCKSRLSSLKEPESLDSEDLLKIVKEGKSPMTGGTDHISHRLLRKGYSDVQVLVIFVIMSLIVMLVTMGILYLNQMLSYLFLIIYGVLVFSALVYFHNLEILD